MDIRVNLTHAAFDVDRQQVIDQASAAGVHRMVLTGTTVEESKVAQTLASQYPGTLYSTAGVHPHDVRHCHEKTISCLRELAALLVKMRIAPPFRTGEHPVSLSSNLTVPSSQPRSSSQRWYRPTFSPEHGVYVVLFVSFLTGAAAAQNWKWETTLALICAFCGFQAEHPWVLQIKQRKSLKLRFWVWGSVYTIVAMTIAVLLLLNHSMLLWIYTGAIVAFMIDAISVWQREQKSIFNEVITFAAVCLSAPFAFLATTGTLSSTVLGLWLLNTLFFSSTIFTVKFRKSKTPSIVPSILYHAIAALIVVGLWYFDWLAPFTAATFAIALCKLTLVLIQRDWYRNARIQSIAALETGAALLFLLIAALSLLPAHL